MGLIHCGTCGTHRTGTPNPPLVVGTCYRCAPRERKLSRLKLEADNARLREALRGLLDEFVYQDGTFYLDEPIDDTIREAYKALGETVPVED